MIYINDYYKYAAAFLLGAVLMFLLTWKGCKPAFDCSTCEGKTIVKIDTIRYAVKVESKPTVIRVTSKPKSILKTDTVFFGIDNPQDVPMFVDLAGRMNASPCDSIYFYTDTVGNSQHYAIITDTVMDNSILGRSVEFSGFTTNAITTKILAERWKLYAGISGRYSVKYPGRWEVSPSILLTIPKIGGIQYSYGVRENSHSVSIMALIRFKK